MLDEALYAQLLELKAFRHLVRHHYGIELRPDKTEAKRPLMDAALTAFEAAVDRLEGVLERDT